MSDGVWVVGFHAVRAALEGPRPVDAVWVQQGRRDGRIRRIEELARRAGVPIRTVPRARLDALAGGVAHTGCAVRTAPVELVDLDQIVAPDDQPARVLVVDGATDPHNVGAVIRTAAAFAMDGVVLAGPSAPPLGGAVERAAAGLVGRVPIARATVAADVLRRFRDAGYWCFGADAAGTPVGGVSVPERWALCVGAEAKGVRAKTRSMVDEWVAIPMAAGVESLNLSVSAAVLMYALAAGSGSA